MTSEKASSTILVSCKQTRFHIGTTDPRELNIEGLDITVVSGDDPPAGKAKGKGKLKTTAAQGTEILVNADLRLKAGQRYALVGRNGSGKSTLLKAIAEKLIPGIPEETRVSILQQTRTDEGDGAVSETSSEANSPSGSGTVLEDVIEKATSQDELQGEIDLLRKGTRDAAGPFEPLRALRQVQHERLEKQHFILDKNYRLRSGDRGLQAKKALAAFEKTLKVSTARFAEDDDAISSETLERETQEAVDMLADLQLQVEPSRIAETESRAKKILLGLGFTDAIMRKPVSTLSGGWRMRAALATALLARDTDILILDEPTNFLDLLGIIWLQRYLESLAGDDDSNEADASSFSTTRPPTLILVSHDRDFITRACTDLLILRGGPSKTLATHHGDLASHELAAAKERQHLLKLASAQDKQRAHIQGTIARNMREGRQNNDENRVRQARSRQKKLDDRWGLQTNAQGHRFKLNRDLAGYHLSARAEVDVPPEPPGVTIALPHAPAPRFAGPLISLEGASFRYPGAVGGGEGDDDVLRGVTLSVAFGDRVGILGLNGAGKSTLIRLLAGTLQPTSAAASVAHHPRLRLGHYSQSAVPELQALGRREGPNLTALALLQRDSAGSAGAAGEADDARALLASVGLAGRTVAEVPLARLSGGQLARCALARVLRWGPQCLLLDEVTTHLDYETVGALREALAGWRGAVVVVSHDRWFVRGVVEEGVEEEEEESEHGGRWRRRGVYGLKGARLELLAGGVREFEEGMERRVRRMMGV